MWGKTVAVAAVLAALAATNLRAAAHEHDRTRLASDTVAARVVVTADASTLRPGSVVLTVSLENTGPALQIHRPRMQSPGYRLELVGRLRQRVARGGTVLLTVRLRGACRTEGDVPPRLVVPVVPASGRVHDVTASVVPDLAELVCGRRPLAETTDPEVVDVRTAASTVTFTLRIGNRSRQVLLVDGLAAEGLALRVPSGLPVAVTAASTADMLVVLTIASCVHLPTPLDSQRVDTLPLGAFDLALSSASERAGTLPYLTATDSPLYAAVRTLAHRRCQAAGF